MGIRDSNMYLCSLDVNLVTAGSIFPVKKQLNSFLGQLALWMEDFLFGIWNNSYEYPINDKIIVTNYEKKLYFLLLLFQWKSPIYVLAFGYVLSQLCFLPKYFSSGFPKYGTKGTHAVPQ
jgi:hypothetical protein